MHNRIFRQKQTGGRARLKRMTVLAGLLFFVFSCRGGENGAKTCPEILNAHCIICHDNGRVCERLGRKNKERWHETVDRMIRRGAALGFEQKTALIDCLDRQGDDVVSYCRESGLKP